MEPLRLKMHKPNKEHPWSHYECPHCKGMMYAEFKKDKGSYQREDGTFKPRCPYCKKGLSVKLVTEGEDDG